MSSENSSFRRPPTTRQTLDGLIRRTRIVDHRDTPLSKPVVAVKGLTSNAKAEDVCEWKLLSGDIVEEINVGGFSLVAPFAGGKTGLQRELRKLYNTGDTIAEVKVRRGKGKIATVQACIVPDESVMLKKQYVLKAVNDANHVVTFSDTTEDECFTLQETRCTHLISLLANTQLKDVYIPYHWEKKINQVLPVHRSSMVFSLMVVPLVPDRSMPVYNELEDTVARAMAWLSAAQASGVPINFLNIQTEALLTKVSGQQASSCTVSREDLSSIINTGIYGFEDYHGIDIGVVRAVRLWYAPNIAEIAIVFKPEEGETRLGVVLSRTDEGFCYVSSVENGTVADRAGLKSIFIAASASGRKLVISRVGEEKITPSMISSSGSIRSFDTISISQKLSIHRQAGQPVRMHLMVWDGTVLAKGWGGSTNAEISAKDTEKERQYQSELTEQRYRSSTGTNSSIHETNSVASSDSDQGSSSRRIQRDSMGEFSFRLSNAENFT